MTMDPVQTVFSCVASKNREKETLAKKKPTFACRAAPPGLRAYQYGTLYDVGSAGYVWSSTIPTGSGNAHNLSFYYGGIYPQLSSNRAHGLQLRCLQE